VNTIQVIATDYSFNARTNNYQVAVASQTARALTYDLDGNLTNVTDGTASTNYQWDAANRLVGIVVGSGSSTTSTVFDYDGLSRRVRITEIAGATTNSDRQFVWSGSDLCEERDITGTNVTKRFFPQGEQISGTNYFFARDHLRSIREMTDNMGAVRARYSYDPWGRRAKVSGDLDADFGFTGSYYHAPSGLHLVLYRAYSTELGRWLSRDPMQEGAGLNMYRYVANNTPNRYDTLGLDPIEDAEQIVERLEEDLLELDEDIALLQEKLANSCSLDEYTMWDEQLTSVENIRDLVSQQLENAQSNLAAITAAAVTAGGGISGLTGGAIGITGAGSTLPIVAVGALVTGAGVVGAAIGYGVGQIPTGGGNNVSDLVGGGLYRAIFGSN